MPPPRRRRPGRRVQRRRASSNIQSLIFVGRLCAPGVRLAVRHRRPEPERSSTPTRRRRRDGRVDGTSAEGKGARRHSKATKRDERCVGRRAARTADGDGEQSNAEGGSGASASMTGRLRWTLQGGASPTQKGGKSNAAGRLRWTAEGAARTANERRVQASKTKSQTQ